MADKPNAPIYMAVDPVCGCPWMWAVTPEELAKRDSKFEREHRESVGDYLAHAVMDGGKIEVGPQRFAAKDCPNCARRKAERDNPPGLPSGDRLYRVRIPMTVVVLARDADAAEATARRELESGFMEAEPEQGDSAHVSVVATSADAGKDWLESAPIVDDDCELSDDELPGDGTVGAILAAYGVAESAAHPTDGLREPDPNQMSLAFPAPSEARPS